MKVYTVATGKEGYFPSLEWGCDHLGYTLCHVGEGEKWGGFLWSLRRLGEEMDRREKETRKSEVVCIVDGYDVILTSKSESLLSFYWSETLAKERPGSILVCEEHPEEECSVFFRSTVVSFAKRYMKAGPFILNTGILIGPLSQLREAIRQMVEVGEREGWDDDEKCFNHLYWKVWGADPEGGLRRTREGGEVQVVVSNRGFRCVCHRDLSSLLLRLMGGDPGPPPLGEKRLRGKGWAEVVEGEGDEWVHNNHTPSKEERPCLNLALHGIWNSDLTPFCYLANLPVSHHKNTFSQTDLNLAFHIASWVFHPPLLALFVSLLCAVLLSLLVFSEGKEVGGPENLSVYLQDGDGFGSSMSFRMGGGFL